MIESIQMPEAQSAYLTAVADATTHASDGISLAATDGYFTTEVSPAPIAEELAQVAVAPLSCEAVVVQSTPMLETQSVHHIPEPDASGARDMNENGIR